MADEMTESEKDANREMHQRLNEGADTRSDEEFAEKLYDEKAPTPEEFSQSHEISTTGGQMAQEVTVEDDSR